MRAVVLPAFLHKELKQHLARFAEKGPDGLVFVGEKGAPSRRTSFGRKWKRARTAFGLPDGFRFYTRQKVVTSRWPDPATSTIDLHFPRTH